MTEPNGGTSPGRTTAASGDASDDTGSPAPPRGPDSVEPSPASATAENESASDLTDSSRETSEPAASRPASGEGPLHTSDLVQRGDQATGNTEPAVAQDGDEGSGPPLVSDADDYLSRWQTIQAGFVDEPKRAVQDADSLVAEVMQRLAESFATERDRLDQQWSGGQEAGTEELRVALQRYRSFFNRLLKT